MIAGDSFQKMDAFAKIYKKFENTISEKKLIFPGDIIITAFSGGSDSLALLLLLNEYSRQHGNISVRAFHYNHMIRGEAADRDEAFCGELCEKLNIPFEAGRGNVPEYAKKEGISLEEAARKLRYEALETFAASLGDNAKIAVAHNYGDRAETVLLNILRGTSLSGLRGIRYRKGRIIRPLMDITKAETYEVCGFFNTEPRRDDTNFVADCRRNRLRLEVIPYIEKATGADLTKRLNELARLSEADCDFIDDCAEKAYRTMAENAENGRIKAEIGKIGELPPALRGRAVKLIISGAKNNRGESPYKDGVGVTETLITRLVNFALSGDSGRIELGKGIFAEKKENYLEVGAFAELKPAEEFPEIIIDMYNIPEIIDAGDSFFELSELTGESLKKAVADCGKNRNLVALDLEKARKPGVLRIRPPRPGDRFFPYGGKGGKSLGRFLIDEKIPREKRTQVSVLEAGGSIIHLFGIRRGKFAEITEKTTTGLLIARKYKTQNPED